MSQPTFFRRTLHGLAPADEVASAALAKIKHGAQVEVKITRPRNIRFHRKFFAMLNLVFDNQDHYQSVDELLAACKLATGHATPIKTKHGLVYVPKSISFAKMSADDFDSFYNRAVNWVIIDVIPGLQLSELDSEVESKLTQFAG